jgi:CHRD domain-containing protein
VKGATLLGPRVARIESRFLDAPGRRAMKRVLIAVLLVSVAAVVACSNDDSESQAKVFNIALTPQGETPPCADAGVNATGTAKVTIAADNSNVVVDVTYSGLSGPATASHIHSGTAAAPGPVVLPFSAPLDSPFSKTLTASDYTPATGAPPDFATFVTALRAGGAGYVNVHTNACKPGEIRGEIQ